MSPLQPLIHSFDEPASPAMINKVPPQDADLRPADQENRRDDISASTKGEQLSVEEDADSHSDSEVEFEFTNLSDTVVKTSPLRRIQRRGSSGCSAVSFGSVQVREYERVIDSTNIYMGLALGWNYNESEPSPVKERNHVAKYANTSSDGANGGGDESRMIRTNGNQRYGMMVRYGFAQKELKQATREAAKFYKQRSREAARSLVVADEKKKTQTNGKPKRRPLLRSMFG